MKFFKCNHCGNIVEMVQNAGVPMVCCGENMQELVPNTTDAATEKHVPVASLDGNILTVEVGSVIHPMEEAHYIQWVALQTKNGSRRQELKPGQEPKVTFVLGDEEPIAVYEYCNLHGLWKKEI